MNQEEQGNELEENPQNSFSSVLANKKIVFAGLFIFLLFILIPVTFYFARNTKPKKDQITNTSYPKAPYAADQLIVKYKDSYTLVEIERLRDKLNEIGVVSQEKVFDSNDPRLKNYYLIKFAKGSNIDNIIKELEGFPEIEKAGPDYIIEVQEIPNDPNFPVQANMTKIQMPDAWNIAKGSNTVRVAIIDSGIDYNHPDLSSNVTNGPDFSTCSSITESNQCIKKARDNDSNDDVGHGTHVAGVIGALTNNSLGVAGINWNVNLIALKAVAKTPKSASGLSSDIVDAIRYAADNADIINMSLGSVVPCNDSRVLGYQDAIDYAISRGVVVISAAGNSGSSASSSTPGSCAGVINVGASDAQDRRASFSNYGPRVNIAAPGVGILSTTPGSSYQSKQGTSMAAPHVAGVAALLLSMKPTLSVTQVKDCILNNSDPISLAEELGGKRLNAFRILSACSGTVPAPFPTSTLSPTPTPTSIVSTTISPITTGGPVISVPPTSTPRAPTPTSVQKYSCSEKTGDEIPRGSIQIGDLVCSPK